jgi:FAD/FMN-containing dehydrogenase
MVTETERESPPAHECTVLTDVHSKLGAVPVAKCLRPRSREDVRDAVRDARANGARITAAGGRHSMGGQPFARNGIVLDMRSLARVLDLDRDRGRVTVDAGIEWPELIAELDRLQEGVERPWSIRQKQTGADRLTIGGSLSANIHGRGLDLPPFISDIESFEIVGADSRVLTASRSENADLFALAIGGYGLFGAVTQVTLRLVRRETMRRDVVLLDSEHLAAAFAHRIAEGYRFGDFQFAIDPESDDFLRRGVFACYRPCDGLAAPPRRALSPQDFADLLELAHFDKTRGFERYAEHYLSTSGQRYTSDGHQLSTYPEGYHDRIDARCGGVGSEMISEVYVPRPRIGELLARLRRDFRRDHTNVIYGTVRLIERDAESFLAWAREPWACVVFNLHVDHTERGLSRARAEFRDLIDRALELGGSYYLTYHRFATAGQVRRAHPRIDAFVAEKRRRDPRETFSSDWYEALRAELDRAPDPRPAA